MKHTGIPVSVGIAETKTVAKIANHHAKRSAKAGGVLDLVRSPYKDVIRTKSFPQRKAFATTLLLGRGPFARSFKKFSVASHLCRELNHAGVSV
jgi:hypothetical protein